LSQPLLADFAARGQLTVVGAIYSLDTGKVAWLSPGAANTAMNLPPMAVNTACAFSVY
jgi:hypothetical protein